MFQVGYPASKYYLLTNIGIIIATFIHGSYYECSDLFLETSPGRLIFSINFKNALEK